MNTKRAKYVLGKDVTPSAAGKSRTNTAVLSVRLSAEEIAAVDAASKATGKAVSQVVREAIKAYLYYESGGRYSITMGSQLLGGTVSTGHVGDSGKATHSEVEFLGGYPPSIGSAVA